MFDGYETFALILTLGVALRALLEPSQYAQIPAYAGTVLAITLFGWGVGGLMVMWSESKQTRVWPKPVSYVGMGLAGIGFLSGIGQFAGFQVDPRPAGDAGPGVLPVFIDGQNPAEFPRDAQPAGTRPNHGHAPR